MFKQLNMSKGRLSILVILLVLFFDQALKIWVKTTMMIGEEHHIFGNWFILHFTENNGMAFGFEFAGKAGKYFLSIFRIVAVSFIGIYISKIIKKELPLGFVVAVSLIFAGATGNILDSLFYGLIFNGSHFQIASFLPDTGSYGSFLQGKVVDMLYFPIIKGHWPSWSPINPKEQFIFFRPIFNIADSAITSGMFLILIFYRRILKNEI
jgi:signal peptidase II